MTDQMDRPVIVEADGGSRGNPGVAGYGALVRDAATGHLLAERAAPLGTASNNVAEYSGLIAGLEAAEEIAPSADVEVRMDSKLVIEQMSGRWKIKHEDMKRLASQARELVARRRQAGGTVTLTWVPRAHNKAADALSNDGMDGRTIDRNHELTAPLSSDQAPPSEGQLTELAEETPPLVPTDGLTGRARITPRAPDMSAKPARIVLVRHGLTEATQAGLLDGRDGTDSPLTPEGTRQAHAAAVAVAGFLGDGPIRVVTSSLARARQTGAAVAARLGVTPEVDDRWDEQSFGDWEGHTVAQVCAQDADGYAQLRSDDTYARPGGESRCDLRSRVLQAYDDLVRDALDDGRPVVVVGHRAAMLIVLAEVIGLTSPWSMAMSPASLTSLRTWSDGGVLVEFVNDTSHLRG
ncbi:Bifunctional protein [Austwickia sp. TVS 96-490-7B]|uniref:bifunctional RNase H/acid phosphatase n=1 Tax=Austwickia sp. TVS 96-490-7B TaxID=2830843 RepID=UPI001DB19943|nr:bifunctional RNase H/acid phosphatase [Austwickia sp. TVS 96-490-7B]MBW3086429.1 Bifunctional protein [Austwickia sp. TVS 96-490-7B]